MYLHEYQAKSLLLEIGVPCEEFAIASNLEEVERAIQDLGLRSAVLKIQVHCGGRKKAGGVRFANGKDEILAAARSLLGMKIANQQTGGQWLTAHQILLTRKLEVKKSFYISVVLDEQARCTKFVCCLEGGEDIEENPQVVAFPFVRGKPPIAEIEHYFGWGKEGGLIVQAMAEALFALDALTIEINPLAVTYEGKLTALDAKITIDDNALFRLPKIAAFFDPSQLSTLEVIARKNNLAYVPLKEGNIGCMVNGAGLAMATLDLLHYFGGSPANFLDVGGGATKEKVAEGFKLLLQDRRLTAIFVNIFGGIMSCITIAEGILQATKDEAILPPFIVRMEGTHQERGKELLMQSPLHVKVMNDLQAAAKEAVLTAGILQ